VTLDLLTIAFACPNIRSLGLSGCQLMEPTFSEALGALRELRHLDISHSSLKGSSLDAIATACGSTLRTLDISGLFR
jgi:Leucine-rich repeat (LRR) protein